MPYYEIISYNAPGTRDNDNDLADGFDSEEHLAHDWRATYMVWYEDGYTAHKELCKDIEALFPELAECGKVYAVQESDSIWQLYNLGDFEVIACQVHHSISCALLTDSLTREEMEVPMQIAAALEVEIRGPDNADSSDTVLVQMQSWRWFLWSFEQGTVASCKASWKDGVRHSGSGMCTASLPQRRASSATLSSEGISSK